MRNMPFQQLTKNLLLRHDQHDKTWFPTKECLLDSSEGAGTSHCSSVSGRQLVCNCNCSSDNWLHRSETDNSNIHLLDGRADGKPLHTISNLHSHPVHLMAVSSSSLMVREEWNG